MIVPNIRQEKRLWKSGYRNLVGVDEVGRGALAGPVVASAVGVRSLEDLRNFLEAAKKLNFKLRDSKRLLPHQRGQICRLLAKHRGFSIKFGRAEPKTIDRLNIRQATLLAMARAVAGLKNKRLALLIDGIETLGTIRGIRIPFADSDYIPQYTFIKGDTKIVLIALASICAKVRRDRLMTRLSRRYPGYGFEGHKGYGTKAHKAVLKRHGPSPIHRRSFLS